MVREHVAQRFSGSREPQPFTGKVRNVDQVGPAVGGTFARLGCRVVPHVCCDVHIRVAGPNGIEQAVPRTTADGNAPDQAVFVSSHPDSACDGGQHFKDAGSEITERLEIRQVAYPANTFLGQSVACSRQGRNVLQPKGVSQDIGNPANG
ncbi:hypothetical protein D3C73_1311010 [compost metagenome]